MVKRTVRPHKRRLSSKRFTKKRFTTIKVRGISVRRSNVAWATDRAKKADKTLLQSRANIRKWKKNPRRYDLIGVDTKVKKK
jgi:hypothetical protein